MKGAIIPETELYYRITANVSLSYGFAAACGRGFWLLGWRMVGDRSLVCKQKEPSNDGSSRGFKAYGSVVRVGLRHPVHEVSSCDLGGVSSDDLRADARE